MHPLVSPRAAEEAPRPSRKASSGVRPDEDLIKKDEKKGEKKEEKKEEKKKEEKKEEKKDDRKDKKRDEKKDEKKADSAVSPRCAFPFLSFFVCALLVVSFELLSFVVVFIPTRPVN